MSLLSSLFCRLTPVVSLLMLATSLAAMPAHPDVVLRHARQGTLDRLAARSRTLHMRTLDQTRTREALPGRIFPSSGTRRIPILVIGYSDVNLSPASSQTFYNNLFNGSTLTPLSMEKYFADMSGNTLDLAIDVHMVGKAANTAAYYGQNINDFDAKPASLVGEAIDKAEAAGINWALYDNDNDGKVDVVMVIHAGPGEEFSDVANHIWSHAWSLTGGQRNGDGANRIHGVTIVEADNDNMLWKGRDLAAGTVEYSDSGRQEDLFVSRSFTAETRPASFWHTASAAPWSSSGTRLSAAGLSSISPSGSVMSFICHVP